MKQILHILDDVALGGVTRLLASLVESLSDVGEHHQVNVTTKMRLAPSLASLAPAGVKPDVVVIHFTSAWAKLPFLASLRLRSGGARVILVEHSYTEAYEKPTAWSTRWCRSPRDRHAGWSSRDWFQPTGWRSFPACWT